jgi:hypothetical protein
MSRIRLLKSVIGGFFTPNVKHFIDFVNARLKYKSNVKMTIEIRSVVLIDALCVCQNLPEE